MEDDNSNEMEEEEEDKQQNMVATAAATTEFLSEPSPRKDTAMDKLAATDRHQQTVLCDSEEMTLRSADHVNSSSPTASLLPTHHQAAAAGLLVAVAAGDTQIDGSFFEDTAGSAFLEGMSVSDNTKKKIMKANRKRPPTKPGQASGRWTRDEHQAFLDGLQVFGREWKKVAERIPTRTSAQIRSHAQKYFAKLAREESVVLQTNNANNDEVDSNNNDDAVLSPSVQANVERILANPSGVQQEVEETLRALQERYRQLQIQLEGSQHQQQQPPQQRRQQQLQVEENPQPLLLAGEQQQQALVVEEDVEIDEDTAAFEGDTHHQEETTTTSSSQQATRKRDAEGRSLASSSSSSSTISSSRELDREELIALHVLGGALQQQQPQQQHIETDVSSIASEESISKRPRRQK